MFKTPLWRILFGTLFGAMAGMSMTMTVFPYATIWLTASESYNLITLANLIIPIVFIWMIGGALTAWLAQARMGIVILGFCGVVSGIVLGLLVGDDTTSLLLAGVVSGLLYGTIGGGIIGYAFSNLMKE
ncbi:hypothetical protein QUF63_01675 [Anaerolineales bacterium HSG25]|nr:hypothetical protein [Anaerolineales bacterium HSG25]